MRSIQEPLVGFRKSPLQQPLFIICGLIHIGSNLGVFITIYASCMSNYPHMRECLPFLSNLSMT